MAFEGPSEGGIDYAPCRYGTSKLLFRGPRRDLTGDYVAFLGSTETYGKFIETPFPEQVAEATGLASVNLGCVNAGVDTFHDDHTVIDICRKARACVVQVMGADRLSNRYYSVHARRNDRFLRASAELRGLFPDVDFADVHFTRHLLRTLQAADPGRFSELADRLSAEWLARMDSLIARVQVPVILLWMPDMTGKDAAQAGEPLFVSRDMLDRLSAPRLQVVEVPVPAFRGVAPVSGMAFSEIELPMARSLPGPEAHRTVAGALTGPLRDICSRKGKGPARAAVRDLMSG